MFSGAHVKHPTKMCFLCTFGNVKYIHVKRIPIAVIFDLIRGLIRFESFCVLVLFWLNPKILLSAPPLVKPMAYITFCLCV